jgi:hypothetical protein
VLLMGIIDGSVVMMGSRGVEVRWVKPELRAIRGVRSVRLAAGSAGANWGRD